MTNKDEKETAQSSECCPKLDPSKYDEKTQEFKDKLFVKDKVTSIFHFPLNFAKVMTRVMERVDKAGAMDKEMLCITDESSLFGTPLFVSVSKEVPEAEMTRISGKFLTKVFEGPYSQMGKFAKQMQEYVKSKGETLKKMYFHYPYCPKCAKKYGKNYVVIYAQVE